MLHRNALAVRWRESRRGQARAMRKWMNMTTATTTTTTAKKKVPANSNRKAEFKANDHVVYPTHGVGKIVEIEEQEVAGVKLELFVITFEKDKMTLRVPVAKAKSVGMRKLSSPDVVATALNTLKGRARIKRTMWSRRAQEYEAKINSGDLVSIAEVVRDLHRAERPAGAVLFRTSALRGRAGAHGPGSGRCRTHRRRCSGQARRNGASEEGRLTRAGNSRAEWGKSPGDVHPGFFICGAFGIQAFRTSCSSGTTGLCRAWPT